MNSDSTPGHLSPKDVAPHIYKWSREELEQMQAMIAGQLHAMRQSDRSQENWQQPNPQTVNRPPVEWNPF
ncbi:MAG TPA: hypothetical protein V6D28_06220 [Leptolyngbyaceae cyanobacterium]